MTADDTRSKEQQIDWDAPITLQDAAAIAGVAYPTLKAWMRAGYLETAPWGARGKVTTRRKLDACVRQRGTRGGGRGPAPKPLPADYQAPPRRGRPPKAKAAPLRTASMRHSPLAATIR